MNIDTFEHYLDQLIEARNLTITAEARSQWWDAVEAIEGPVFRDAIRRIIADDEAYPSPARVRAMCRVIINERLSRAVQPPPPSGLTQDQYRRWEREWKRQIIRGESVERAEELALKARHSDQQVTSGGSQCGVIEGTIMNF